MPRFLPLAAMPAGAALTVPGHAGALPSYHLERVDGHGNVFLPLRDKGRSGPALAVLDMVFGAQLARLAIGRGLDEAQ